MKKGLVTAFVIASVLAFNACKKEEGPVGPIGPTGPTGAPGAQGPIGPQGVKGEDGADGQDGATIRSDAGAPDASLGNVGDYYFDKTDRLLYGPKTEAGWGDAADAVTLTGPAGPAGADGVDGANGTSFTAGAGAPTAAVGQEGDFYFDTTTSTFYGPKGETDWTTSSVLPLTPQPGSTTYYYTAGFNITDEDYVYGEAVEAEYSDYALFSSYKINSEDLYRIARYSNWHLNREMMFEDPAQPGVFSIVPRGAYDFADPANPTVSILPLHPNAGSSYLIPVGREFKYTGSTEAEATHTFSITAEDIARLSVNNGDAFDYLTYAATKAEDIELGENVTFFQKKSLKLVEVPELFKAEYVAETTIDLNALVGAENFERLKKEGAYVFAGYTFFDADDEEEHITGHILASRGYINMTVPATMYFNGGVAYGPNGMYTTDVRDITTPLTGGVGSADLSFNFLAGNPYLSHPLFQVAGTGFGEGALEYETTGVNVALNTFTHDQIATPSTRAPEAYYDNGKLHITWDIVSGSVRNGRYDVSPLTYDNVTAGAEMEDWWTDGSWIIRTFETDYYTGSRLENNTGQPITTGSTSRSWTYDAAKGDYVVIDDSTPDTKTIITGVDVVHGGLTKAEWEAKPLVRVVVNVVDAKAVAAAKAAGIDVNNPEALVNFANSLQLQ